MPTTASRTGDNADPGNFLYQLPGDRNVTMDVTGPGVLAFARYNHWHGSPWHYIVDGKDHVIQETSAANPHKPVAGSVFIPEKQFPSPLAYTWSTTKGADLMWVPLPFEKSFTMAYGRTRYGTGYYIYHKFPVGATNLSRPIKRWTMHDVPPKDVLDLISKAGEDIAPKGKGITTLSGFTRLEANKARTLAVSAKSPSTIRAIKFIAPRSQAEGFARARLRVYWDDSRSPSVDAPLGLFFGAGSMYNRENKQYLVKGFPMNIRFDPTSVRFACYFPMPFMKSARVELVETEGRSISGIAWNIRYKPYRDPANWVCNFHATYVDHATGIPGYDLVLLDTTKTEGGGDWCGHFVGTSIIFSDHAYLSTLEGDPRFFFDDSNTPQAQGTGTEHSYKSPTSSAVQTLTSRYELSMDVFEGKEIHPATTDTGRFMTGVSTFTLKLDPKNVGALLRRKFDYAFPNQCARIFVSDVKPGSPWREVGVWYTGGSNVVMHSDPPGELDPTQPAIWDSGRRWREDEFLLPRFATEGRSAVRVKVEFTPRNIPLWPGQPLPEQAWSEYRYTAYSYVMPKV